MKSFYWNKLNPIILIILLVNFSCSPSKNTKQEEIENFQLEMKKINDSSAYYFDLGIKLLEEDKDSIEIIEAIKPKLIYFQNELDNSTKNFHKTAEKLKLSKVENERVFNELNESFKTNFEKYQYLKENGVIIN